MPSYRSSYSGVERLLGAVERKIQITHFHYQKLKTLANDKRFKYTNSGMPSIEIQAYFEGVIIASYSSIDKLITVLTPLIKQFPEEKIDRTTLDSLKPLEQCIPSIGRLITKNIFYCDLRLTRNKAIHAAQIKTPGAGGPDLIWIIDKPKRSNYSGGRSILEYTKTALDFAADCQPIINEIRQKFVGFNGTTNQARHSHCGNYPLDRQ